MAGAVIFHEFVKKTPEEIRNSKEQREALRNQRRAEQEANVKKKEEERNSKKKRKVFVDDKPQGEDYDVVADDDLSADEEGPAVGAVDKDDMEDADWYRQEVGEEPDEGFMAGQSSSRRSPSKYNAHFGKRRDSDGKGKESGGQNRKD